MFWIRIYKAFPVILLLLEGNVCWETTGTSFMFPLLAKSIDGQSYLTIFGRKGTYVEITTEDPQLVVKDIIDGSEVLNITLNHLHHIILLNSTSKRKAVHISSNDSVAVNVITMSRSSVGSFNVIPDVAGGYLRHRVITHCPEEESCRSFIALVGIMNSMAVIVTLKGQGNMTIDGTMYTNGDAFTISVMKFEVKIFTCVGDISGSEILTTFPINVFSGSFCSDGVRDCDLTMEHIPPKRNLGSEYTLSPFPPGTHGFYRLVGTHTGTEVNENVESYTLQAGDFLDIEDVRESRTFLSSSGVIIAMLFTDTQENKYSKAMIIMQPNSIRYNAARMVSPTGFTSYCQVHVDTEPVQPWLNDRYLCYSGLYHQKSIVSDYFIPVSNGDNTIGVTREASSVNVFGLSAGAVYGHTGIPWKVGNISIDECDDKTSSRMISQIMSTHLTISEGSTNSYNFLMEPSSTQHSGTTEEENNLSGNNVQSLTLSELKADLDTSSHFPSAFTVQIIHSEIETSLQELPVIQTLDESGSFLSSYTDATHSIHGTWPVQTVHGRTDETVSFIMFESLVVEEPEENIPDLSTSEDSDNTKANKLVISGSSYGISISSIHPTAMPSGLSDQRLHMMALPTPLSAFSGIIDSMMPSLSILSTDDVLSPSLPVTIGSAQSEPKVLLSPEVVPGTPNAIPAATLRTQAPASTSILCRCNCLYQEYGMSGLEAWINAMRRNLTVDKATLSATIRKRISALDLRKSATGIGTFGTGIVALVFVLIFMNDVVTLMRFFWINCRLFFRSQ